LARAYIIEERGAMADVEHNYNVALPKIDWPQDTPYRPSGWGKLTPIETINQQSVRREYFSYTGVISSISYNGLPRLLQIPLFKDGDFWCTAVRAFQVRTDPATNIVANTLYADFSMKDSITGYNFFTPSINVHFLSIPTAPASGLPASFVQWWPEPYCFLRGGNIQLQLTPFSSAGTNTYDCYFALDGWKEYEHAAN
jgi:hypothetical protein